VKTETLKAAETALKDAETLKPLPEIPVNHPIANIDADVDQTEVAIDGEVLKRIESDLDITDASSIMRFGSDAQAELTAISQEMLGGVKNKDVGPAGDALRGIVTTIRGFSVGEGDMREKRSFWEKLTGKIAPAAQFMARYETVQSQLDKITDNLLLHEHTLMKDVKFLDILYEKTLEFYREIGIYIAAGEAIIARLDAEDIADAEKAVADADEKDAMIKAQELRDLRSARDDLERRVHDLKLTRQVTMQALPSMRLVQENDKSLIQKINSTLVNTVPLWETQLAQAITIQRSAQAARAVRDANDLTNDLLTANAANLREANASVRKEIERGIFDIEAVKQANTDLVATIEESLQIADEGKRKRADAEAELQRMENELKTTLARAAAKK
jgi:uncharacterized protein YaaN involved in tellurite resistance